MYCTSFGPGTFMRHGLVTLQYRGVLRYSSEVAEPAAPPSLELYTIFQQGDAMHTTPRKRFSATVTSQELEEPSVGVSPNTTGTPNCRHVGSRSLGLRYGASFWAVKLMLYTQEFGANASHTQVQQVQVQSRGAQ